MREVKCLSCGGQVRLVPSSVCRGLEKQQGRGGGLLWGRGLAQRGGASLRGEHESEAEPQSDSDLV